MKTILTLLLFSLSIKLSVGQVFEADNTFKIKYPFYYETRQSGLWLVYNDTLFENQPQDSLLLSLKEDFISSSSKAYSKIIGFNKLDTLTFYYPGTKYVYYKLFKKENTAVLRLYDFNQTNQREYFFEKDLKFQVDYNETWTSPNYPKYDRLTLIKPGR